MRKGLKILIIIVLAVIVLLGLLIGAAAFFNSDFYRERKALRKEKLIRYSYSSSGDMNGSHYAEEIRTYEDGRVILSISESNWYGEDDRNTEYEVDPEILTELEKVFRKYNMSGWDRKKISEFFVADGASHSYSFTFGAESFGFSSQMYTGRYRKGVSELQEVIDRYGENKKQLPGLLLSEKRADDEWIRADEPTPGEVELKVYGYCRRTLYFRVLNGLEEGYVRTLEPHLYHAETGEEIAVMNRHSYSSESTVSAGYSEEDYLKLDEFLAPGRYRLETGDLKTEFEIGQLP